MIAKTEIDGATASDATDIKTIIKELVEKD